MFFIHSSSTVSLCLDSESLQSQSHPLINTLRKEKVTNHWMSSRVKQRAGAIIFLNKELNWELIKLRWRTNTKIHSYLIEISKVRQRKWRPGTNISECVLHSINRCTAAVLFKLWSVGLWHLPLLGSC